ncbi:MAG TPA: urate hydroxylase PuuD, partial [Flavisolibacter sp.]|nr:urate hydroxylase PuuD [Flavisolibacter sp.]
MAVVMLNAIILAALTGILIMLVILTFHFRAIEKGNKDKVWENEEKSETYLGYIYASLVLVIVAMVLFFYFGIRGTPLEGHLLEWMNIVVRVMHITFGIAWIGASFYFVFLENALNRTE